MITSGFVKGAHVGGKKKLGGYLNIGQLFRQHVLLLAEYLAAALVVFDDWRETANGRLPLGRRARRRATRRRHGPPVDLECSARSLADFVFLARWALQWQPENMTSFLPSSHYSSSIGAFRLYWAKYTFILKRLLPFVDFIVLFTLWLLKINVTDLNLF